MLKKLSLSICILILSAASILADPPLWSPSGQYSEFDQFFIKKTNWQPQQAAEANSPLAEAPQIEAFWVGATQWMTGHDNGMEAFDGSIAKGQDFFGTSLAVNQYVSVDIIFSSDTSEWSNIQIFRRDDTYDAGGVGTFPGSAWDVSDSTNPRRLNLCIVEYDDGIGAPPNGTWDPDTSNWGNYEYLFVMNSDYDSTGTYYDNTNILFDDLDLMYTWLARLAPGHTFFETEPAELQIKTFIRLNAVGFETDVFISWVNPGPDPDHFRLFWGTSNPPTTELTEVTGATSAFWHNGVAKNDTYFYELRSYNSSDVELATSTIVLANTTERSTQMSIEGYWHEREDYGDCWGYVDDNGHEYALICARGEGLSIIDIDTVPNVEVGFYPQGTPGADVKDVKLYEHYAVVISENYTTHIVDISDVTNPTFVAGIAGGRHNGLVDGDYLYLCGGSYGGLQIYSLANPASPSYQGFYNPYYYHDYAIRNDTLIGCGIYGDGVDIIDVTDKTNPTLVGHFNYAGSGAHNAAFSSDGSHVLIGDEIGSSGRWTRVFDISNPQSVSMVSQIIVNASAIVHNCYVRDSFAVIGHYTEGVRIWNIANPSSPFEVAHFDTYLPSFTGFDGVWSVFPYLPSGRILASDMSTGLYVLSSPYIEPFSLGCCVGTRGDVNNDGSETPNLLDLNFLVNKVFRGGPEPVCLEEGDCSGDSIVNILDLNVLVNYIFRGGPLPGSCP